MNMALKVVTLEELKAQMREDFDGEDELIKLYGEAAEDAVIGATRRTLDELEDMGKAEGGEGFLLPLQLPLLPQW